MSAASLLAELRASGGSITSDGERLIIEGPRELITAELRTELLKHKVELIQLLAPSSGDIGEDARTIEARNQIAGLLAAAYRRIVSLQRTDDYRATSDYHELASSCGSSVHGVVP